MADLTYSSLPVEVHRNEEQGVYEFGVVLNGVFVVFAVRKLGGVDQDLRRAAAALSPASPEPSPTGTANPSAETTTVTTTSEPQTTGG